MTTETVDAGSSSFTPAEDAYFASGGEGTIPGEGLDTAAVDVAATAGAAAVVDGAAAVPDAAAAAAKGNDHVPLARFLDEKKARKALETQVAELRGKFSIIEKLNPPAAANDAATTPPTAEDDIFGKVNNQSETLAQIQKRLDDADAATKATAEQNTFVTNYRDDAASFEKTTPDYKAAYNFVLGNRAAELLAIGFADPNDPTLTPDEKQSATKALHEALVADEFAIAQRAFQSKKSPAEVLYGLAKQRGYKPAAAADAAAADTGKGAEILDNIERGQAANKSLAPVGGASGDAGMTAERLLAMPMDEFEAWTVKNPAAAKRIMGG